MMVKSFLKNKIEIESHLCFIDIIAYNHSLTLNTCKGYIVQRQKMDLYDFPIIGGLPDAQHYY